GVDAPTVAACEIDGTAFVVGVAAPSLVVPLPLWRRLDAAGRRAMCLHETAHVRRRDPLRLAALSIVVDLLWPAFPLRWIASRLRRGSPAGRAASRRGGTTASSRSASTSADRCSTPRRPSRSDRGPTSSARRSGAPAADERSLAPVFTTFVV